MAESHLRRGLRRLIAEARDQAARRFALWRAASRQRVRSAAHRWSKAEHKFGPITPYVVDGLAVAGPRLAPVEACAQVWSDTCQHRQEDLSGLHRASACAGPRSRGVVADVTAASTAAAVAVTVAVLISVTPAAVADATFAGLAASAAFASTVAVACDAPVRARWA